MKTSHATSTSVLVVVVGLAAALGLRGAPEPAVAAGTDAETEQGVALRVDGMQNVGCALQVRHTLEGLEGVASATVDLETGSARVEYDPERVGPESMITAVNAVGYRASLPDDSSAPAQEAGAHAATDTTLAAEEIDRVADFVAEQLLEGNEMPAEETIREATGLTVSVADLPAVQAAVVTRLAADARGQELLAGSRCSDYGACSLWRNLAGATGEELARYEGERARDGERLDGAPLPAFTAQDLDGRQVRSQGLTGRPALITLLAVHCTHSMDTFPVLQELHREYGPQGLQVVGVLVHSGSAEDARGWVPRFAPEYPVWVHEDASLGDAIGSRLVPTYLLVDAEGRMQQILVGFKSRQQVATAIQSSLGLTPGRKGGEAS